MQKKQQYQASRAVSVLVSTTKPDGTDETDVPPDEREAKDADT